MTPDKLIVYGNDNYGKPRQDFADKIAKQSDKEFFDTCEQFIWLSAYAYRNPRSDFHWMRDLCCDEAERRGDKDIYKWAWRKAVEKVFPTPLQ